MGETVGSSSLSDQGCLAGEVEPPEGPALRVSLGRPVPHEGPVLCPAGWGRDGDRRVQHVKSRDTWGQSQEHC